MPQCSGLLSREHVAAITPEIVSSLANPVLFAMAVTDDCPTSLNEDMTNDP